MNCPKCNCNIDENMLVCPNCKKVLKLECPKCHTINKSNTCRKCGFVIITKCHNCGKVNQTIKEKCSRCGFSTFTSVAINSSLIDEFACLTVEFPNITDIRTALGSTKLEEKFKASLDKLILNYTKSIGVTREIVENIYIIRFNKDNSFRASAKNAVLAAIEIQNMITELNFKLKTMKNTSIQCNIAVLKRDIYAQPNQYKSGFDIRLIYQHKKDFNLLNNLQIITDSFVYEQICDDFDLSVLAAKIIKNEMMTFFELKLKKYIKIPKPKKVEEEEVSDLAKLNIFNDGIDDEDDDKQELYDVEAISFNELKCSFKKIKSINLISEILDQFKKNSKKIISIKHDMEFAPRTSDILNQLENLDLYKNVFRVTCYDEMKYKPYGFFYELISSIYNYAQSPKGFAKNNFEMFNGIDPAGFVKDLINLTERKFPHPEDVRYSLFDIFFNIFNSMPPSVIYIENFDKIDDTSHEVLQLFFEKQNELNVSYLITAQKDFSLHKNSHFLLANPNYCEILVMPSTFKKIIEKDFKKYEKILESYYMGKISQNTKGSILYFENAIEYLVEKSLLTLEKNVYSVSNFENILIPPTLDELIIKRINYLAKSEKDAYRLFAMLLLFGPMVDMDSVNLMQIPEIAKTIQKLCDKKYIYLYNNTIYVQNYCLYRANFISGTSTAQKRAIAEELLNKVFSSAIKHPAEAILYKILERGKQEFIAWEKLSRLNASMGDFSAYLNCNVKFLKLLDTQVTEGSQKTIEEYKMEVYENISNLLYKYTPNEIHNIAQIILNNVEKTTDDTKIINLCNKMLQGCLIGGNYSYALELIHKILSKFPNSSINPSDSNFSIAYFLISLVKIEVLFSIGNLKECIEAGDDILGVIKVDNISKLKPENLSVKQFEDAINDAMCFVAISRILSLQTAEEFEKFLTKIQTSMGELPEVLKHLYALGEVVRGEKIVLQADTKPCDEKFSKIALNFIKAFNDNRGDYKKFADNIYQAKISARMNKLTQIELICDLLIGYSYFRLKQNKKASSIYYNILESSMKNGLKMVTYLDWYLISMLKFEQKDIDVAFGIANNAIVQLEKDSTSGDFIFFLLRLLLAEILSAKGDNKSAELCLNNAKFISEKYGLKHQTGE